MRDTKTIVSTSEGRRIVAMGAVFLNDKPVSGFDEIDVNPGDILRVGKTHITVITEEMLSSLK